MRIAVPKEIKDSEHRVSLTPDSVVELVKRGHQVLVEHGAGVGAGLTDAEYSAVGAILDNAEALFAQADLIVKVKEPLRDERKRLRRGQILFTYLHLAPDREQTTDLVRSGATCIAYETVTSPSGGLPLLTPMSEIAGCLAPQIGAHYLEKAAGGRGILLGGAPGVPAGNVLIIGCGVSGAHAAEIAVGMAANVTVIDRSADVLRRMAARFGTKVKTLYSTPSTIAETITIADLVICAALIPAAAAPRLVTRSMIKLMKPGSVIVDISIDQGGCSETSQPTTYSHPSYTVDNVIHYCVANMPGGVPRTSTFALNTVTLPFVIALADKGWRAALKDDENFRDGLNVHDGHITCAPVAAAHSMPYTSSEQLLT